MTLKLDNIVIDPADTALSYGIGTTPNPLQVGNNGSITILVSASTTAVICNSLTFTVAIGSNSNELTTDATSIAAQSPDGWTVSSDNEGGFTFTPPDGSITITGTGYAFELNSIKVNDQVGSTPLKIKETVTLNNQQHINRYSLPLSKFPQHFAFEYLQVRPTSVAPGGTVQVSWSTRNDDASCGYSLSYGATTVPNLKDVEMYPVPNLLETTTFTLNITAGGDALYQQQCTATVTQPAIGEFNVVGEPNWVAPGSTIKLYWQTEYVDHCSLSLNGVVEQLQLPANMASNPGYSVTIPDVTGEYTYTLTAFPGKDNTNGVSSSVIINAGANVTSFGIVGNPPNVQPGSTIQLDWSTENTNHCTLSMNGNPVAGANNLPLSTQGYPITAPLSNGNYTYTLTAYPTAQDTDGIASSVTVNVLIEIESFGIVGNPSTAPSGSTIQLYWSTENTNHCTLSLNSNLIAGAENLPANMNANSGYVIIVPASPGKCSYTLTAFPSQSNDGGVTSSSSLNVSPVPKVLSKPISNEGTFPYSIYQMLLSPDNSTLYLGGPTWVSILPIASPEYTRTPSTYYTPPSGNYTPMALSPDGSTLNFVAAVKSYPTQQYGLIALDTSNSDLNGGFWQPSPVTLAGLGIADKGEKLVFVRMNGSTATVYVTSATHPYPVFQQQSFTLPSGSLITCIVGNSQGNQFLLVDAGSGHLFSYDYNANSVTPLAPTNTRFALFSQDGSHYYLAKNAAEIDVVNAATDTVVSTISLPASARVMILNATGDFLFASLDNNTVAWINIATSAPAVEFTLPVGTYPTALAASSDSKWLYVSDYGGSGSVSAIIRIIQLQDT